MNKGLEWTIIVTPVKLQEVSSAPTGVAIIHNTVAVYAKDKAGVSNLYWKADDGTEYDLGSVSSGSGATGQVTFWSGAHSLSGDNNLFWDNTNKRLGIGTTTPSFQLHLLASGAQPVAALDAFGVSGAANSPTVFGRASRGTSGAPTATQLDDILLGLSGAGRDNGGAFTGTRANITERAGENWTTTNQGSYINVELTPLGSTTRVEKFRFNPTSSFVMGSDPIANTNPGFVACALSGGSGGSNAYLIGVGTGAFGNYQGRQARGTVGGFTATQLDDVIIRFSAIGYGATAFAGSFRAAMDFNAAETWTDLAQGTYIKLATTPTGSTTSAERFRIGPSGQLGIGGATYGTSRQTFQSTGASSAPVWANDFGEQASLMLMGG